jgi:predicted GNAT superfamily acetyltransferase
MRHRSSVVHAPRPSGPEIRVRHCHSLAECERCLDLQRQAWGFQDKDAVPVPLFVVAQKTGGQVLGAFDGDEMIGFTLAVAGYRDGRPLLFSHMTAVLERYRNFGVGGTLKELQREDALARGIRVIEWTFDPLQVKNGYFNLVRLGAIARRIFPNLYGITSSPLHGGLPTDRLLAEWHLASPRVRRTLGAGAAGTAVYKRKAPVERIHVPGQLDEWKRSDRGEALRTQTEIREQFARLFARGWVATGLERDESGADYVLEKI